jgi:hypothetical protein
MQLRLLKLLFVSLKNAKKEKKKQSLRNQFQAESLGFLSPSEIAIGWGGDFCFDFDPDPQFVQIRLLVYALRYYRSYVPHYVVSA